MGTNSVLVPKCSDIRIYPQVSAARARCDWPESSYHGIEGVERFLAEWLEVWGDYEAGVEIILSAPDGRVLVVCWQRGKGRVSDLDLEMRSGQINTVRNGKITRVDNYQDPDEAFEAAGIQVREDSRVVSERVPPSRSRS